MTATDELADQAIFNQHLIEKYKNSVIATMLIFFKRMQKLLDKEIKAYYDEDHLGIKEKNALKKRLNDIQKLELDKIQKQILKDSHKFLGSQAEGYENQLKEVLSDVSDFIKIKRVDDKLLKKRFDKAKIEFEDEPKQSLATFWSTFFLAMKTSLNQNVESAYRSRKTTKEFTEGLNKDYKLHQTQMKAVIFTIIQQAYKIANREVNLKNEAFISGYWWQSVLDGRTSPICVDYSGKYWLYGNSEASTLPAEVYSPIHYKCRSSNPPITKSYAELGIAVGDLNASQKELLSKSTQAPMNYTEWFEKQSEATKLEVLGKTRYNIYKSGNMKVDKFYDNGEKLTINQFRKKYKVKGD